VRFATTFLWPLHRTYPLLCDCYGNSAPCARRPS